MISVTAARQFILENTNELPVQYMPLADAAGSTLAAAIYATQDIPAFEQSSMDGYAIRFEDFGLPLTIKGEMQAGTGYRLDLLPGQAVRIFTGAPLPVGADTVVMQEKVVINEGMLTILDMQLVKGAHVRGIGAEVKKGSLAIAAGTQLTPAAIGFLAGTGFTGAVVYGKPVVGIILTGKELQAPGRELAFGQVYESNSYSLIAALKQAQISELNCYTADDHLDELTAVLEKALQANDIVLLTGGVSVGDYDFVIRAAERLAVTQIFHKVKQKPGKPLYFGKKGEKLVFGLPGNPSSVLSCFYQYVLPALEKQMHHKNSVQRLSASLTHEYSKPAGLTHFLKAHFEDGKVTPLNAQESFRMSSFAQSNCMIELGEEETMVAAGTTVKICLFPA